MKFYRARLSISLLRDTIIPTNYTINCIPL